MLGVILTGIICLAIGILNIIYPSNTLMSYLLGGALIILGGLFLTYMIYLRLKGKTNKGDKYAKSS